MEAIQTVIRVQNIRYDKAEEALYIIDQTKLPGEEREVRLRTVEEMEEAIRALRVRGAPAIGICAAYCLYVLARSIDAPESGAFLEQFRALAQRIGNARPTAVNLSWAVRAMVETAEAHRDEPRAALLEAL